MTIWSCETVNEITANGYRAPDLVDYERMRRLEREVGDLRRQNAALALALRYAQMPGRIAGRARDDAMLLVADYTAGMLIGRAAMEERHGMGRRRWEWCRALLKLARCTDQFYRLQTLDPRLIERRLDNAVDRVIDEGLHVLKNRLPPGRRNELA